MALKRIRGLVLRFVLRRSAATTLGLALIAPAAWLMIQDLPWESPITDGLGLILGATGVAFLAAGIGGRRPDWVEPN